MDGRLTRFKPGVRRNTLLFMSALLWTLIGLLLLAKGSRCLLQLPQARLFLFAAALTVGSLKSIVVLDTTARRSTERILLFQDGTCLGAVYSVKTWILVLCMMSMGVILRSYLPISWLSFLLLTIGWALLFSSRHAWRAWWSKK